MSKSIEQQSLNTIGSWPLQVGSIDDMAEAWRLKIAQWNDAEEALPKRIFEQKEHTAPIPLEFLRSEARRLYDADDVSESFYKYERKLDDSLAFLNEPSNQQGAELERLRRILGLFDGMYSASIVEAGLHEGDDRGVDFVKFCGGRLSNFIEKRYQDSDCPVYERRLLEELEMVNLAYSLGIDAVDVPVIETEDEKATREMNMVKVCLGPDWYEMQPESPATTHSIEPNPELCSSELIEQFNEYRDNLWEYDSGDYTDGPKGVVFKLSYAARAHLANRPEEMRMLERVAEIKTEYPYYCEMRQDDYEPFVGAGKFTETAGRSYGEFDDADPYGRDGTAYKGMIEDVESGTVELFRVMPKMLSSHARQHLLEYGSSLRQDDYDRLLVVKDKDMDSNQRLQFAEAFLTTEFGDDFGEMVLEIAENQDSEPSHEVFDALAKIRESSEAISRHYESDVEGFADAYQVAWNKRTTELLATISDMTVGERMRGEAVAALKLVAYAATEIARANDGEFVMAEAGADVGHATLRSVGAAVTKTIRPTGSAPRIGDTVKIPKELIPESAMSKDKRLSVRLDFDEYGLSLDIGSSARDGVNVSGVAGFVAEQLAKGELRLMTRRQMRDIGNGVAHGLTTVTLHGNHVREAFEGVEIDARKFAELVVEHADTLKLATERP